jgi:hypothetical protein
MPISGLLLQAEFSGETRRASRFRKQPIPGRSTQPPSSKLRRRGSRLVGDVAPASMRAISSRRSSSPMHATEVDDLLAASDGPLAIRQCVAARAATCGAWVTESTCTFSASRAAVRRWRPPPRRRPRCRSRRRHKRRRRTAIGQRHLERQQETRQFAARGDLHHRARPCARVGAHRTRPVDAGSSGALSDRLSISTRNSARSSFSAGNSAMTASANAAPVEWRALGQVPSSAACRNAACASVPAFPKREGAFAGVEIGKDRRPSARQVRTVVHRHIVFARSPPEREQPFFDILQFARIEVAGPDSHLHRGSARRTSAFKRRIERHRVIEQFRRLFRLALQPPQQPADNRHRRTLAADNTSSASLMSRPSSRPSSSAPAFGKFFLLPSTGESFSSSSTNRAANRPRAAPSSTLVRCAFSAAFAARQAQTAR